MYFFMASTLKSGQIFKNWPWNSQSGNTGINDPKLLGKSRGELIDQDELIDLRNDSGCRDLFEDVPVTEFWIQVSSSYPQISKNCLMKLLPFTTTWLCESAFSSLLNIKSKPRNRLDVAADIRCALSSTAPRIQSLVDKIQQQPY